MAPTIPAATPPPTGNWSPARRPRLARLDLQGFKSFANRTSFVFEPGITAIVGPNGSGKSNVADAIRWVLGEQGTGNLRARRTEDVIFAGGQGRAAGGLVEATLTLDNADGWLPVDFAEVTITRRADRSGDSQYLLNNRRVRLKDVLLLTASLGQSHVVVGQGLVDAALSQRPEERRGLFEHAANLTGLRLKVAEAERNLQETDANSVRLRDVLAEIEPRLKGLERAARQAREWQGVRDRLRALQRALFADVLRASNATIARATADADRSRVACGAAEDAAARAETAVTTAATNLGQARAALNTLEADSHSIADQMRRLAHDRELTSERIGALARRRTDLAEIEAGLEEQANAVATERTTLAAALAALTGTLADQRDALARATEANRTAHEQRSRLEAAMRSATSLAADDDRRAADLDRRLALLRHQQEMDAGEMDRLAQERAVRSTRIALLERDRIELEQAADAGAQQAASVQAERAAHERALAEASDALSARTREIADRDRRIGQTRGRWDGLRRLHESGAGLHAGVRETLRAAAAGEIDGVRGTVGSLIDLPADLDTAIEVALGGHLQDVVVDRWADAERAIAHLRRAGAGRATFQPIDTVRQRRRPPGEPATSARPDVRGVAADLVRTPTEVREVVDALLGRTLVVESLPTARAILPSLPTGWNAVTLTGEMARAGGSVTGGAPVRESGLLERERELRGLPQVLSDLEGEQVVAHRDRVGIETRVDERRAALAQCDARLLALRAADAERERQRNRTASWFADLHREELVGAERLDALDKRAASAAAELAARERERDALGAQHAEVVVRRQASAVALDEAIAALLATEQALAAGQSALATTEERIRSDRRREAALDTRAQAIGHELALRGERGSALTTELATLLRHRDRLDGDVTALAKVSKTMADGLEEAREAVKRAEASASKIGTALVAARDRVLAAEREANARRFDLERAEADLDALGRRIRDELDLDDPESLLTDAEPNSDGVVGRGDVPPEPRVPLESSSAAREREIDLLKHRLQRIGYAGDDAVATFERESAHQTSLKAQLDDVERAAESLRVVVGDLHRAMRQRFDDTVAHVAAAFSEAFADLFGGGTARLVQLDGDQAGVDIVAHPPGKRPQSLALLSGGERALTGAALLFAILRVNPAPFCLLDEVDAALDEANVLRFRDRLRTLAEQTQVIVVTHNRGTIETADSLYGVTMGADGVSQVLSLRLAQTEGNAAD